MLAGKPFRAAGIARSLCRQVLFLLAAEGPSVAVEPTDANGGNRSPATPGLQLATLKPGQTRLACDWLVVGAGPAGCIMAAELAETGQSVLLVDRGKLLAPGQSVGEAGAAGHLLETWNGWSLEPDAVVATTARTFGGGSVVNWGTCLDPPGWLLAEWQKRTGFDFPDDARFQHSHFAVRRRLEVTESELVCPVDLKLKQAAHELGIAFRATGNNTGGCQACRSCQSGCPSGSKRDMRMTWLMDAERLGVFLLPGCEVSSLELAGREARMARANLVDQAGQRQAVEVRFRNVVLAGGALHTPAILMRSGFASPHLGRHLSLHPSVIVPALFPEILPARTGPLQAWVSELPDPIAGNVRLMMERSMFSPGLAAISCPFRSSREMAAMIDAHAYWAGLLVLARDAGDGAVGIGRQGEVELRYRLTKPVRTALGAGAEFAGAWAIRAGASAVYAPDWSACGRLVPGDDSSSRFRQPGRAGLKAVSAHQMGTCRMGDSPQSSVVDLTGRVFGLENVFVADASVFPSASGVNPLVTICALSHFLAQQIKGLAGHPGRG